MTELQTSDVFIYLSWQVCITGNKLKLEGSFRMINSNIVCAYCGFASFFPFGELQFVVSV